MSRIDCSTMTIRGCGIVQSIPRFIERDKEREREREGALTLRFYCYRRRILRRCASESTGSRRGAFVPKARINVSRETICKKKRAKPSVPVVNARAQAFPRETRDFMNETTTRLDSVRACARARARSLALDFYATGR